MRGTASTFVLLKMPDVRKTGPKRWRPHEAGPVNPSKLTTRASRPHYVGQGDQPDPAKSGGRLVGIWPMKLLDSETKHFSVK